MNYCILGAAKSGIAAAQLATTVNRISTNDLLLKNTNIKKYPK